MKPYTILIAKAETVEKAVTALNEEIKNNFESQGCEIAQLFIVPELIAQNTAIAKPGEVQGRPAVQITAVALMQSENPVEMLARTFSPLLEKAATEYSAISWFLTNWIETLKAMQPTQPAASDETKRAGL